MRIVLDTDVLIAGLRSPTGASAALLALAIDGLLEFALTVPLAIEYEAVCLRQEQRDAFGLNEEQIRTVLDALISAAIQSPSFFTWRPQLRDANDELVLDAAVNGGATHLVSFNIRDFGDAPARFGIRCLRPADMLKLIRRKMQ